VEEENRVLVSRKPSEANNRVRWLPLTDVSETHSTFMAFLWV